MELLDQVTSGITTLMAKYGDDGMALLEELMPFFGELLDPARSASERRVGICVLDDIIEHSPAGEAVWPGSACAQAEAGGVADRTCSCWMRPEIPMTQLHSLVEWRMDVLNTRMRCSGKCSCMATCQDVLAANACAFHAYIIFT